MSTKDGGPAFPVAEVFDERRGEVTQYASFGMSLRDYFAAKAMQAMCASGAWPGEKNRPGIARAAFLMADEMIKQRSE